MPNFKDDFLFGVASSATQIEGGAFQDGKGKSIWDYYSENKCIIFGQDCYTCCDSYNRLESDLEYIKNLGVNSYRFSINWTRIQPTGSGAINQKGIDYYNKLIDGLLAINVKPMITLFHWDLPLPLHEAGGFLNRDIADRFYEYGKICAEYFSDRVELFSVFNEALAVIDFMYIHPVGNLEKPKTTQEVFVAIHNLLRAQAAATYGLRDYAKKPIQVGMVNCSQFKMPASNEKEDIEAARKGTFAVTDDILCNTCTFWDPTILGQYNAEWLEKFNLDTSFIEPGDMEYIKSNPDFMGCNVYGGQMVKADEFGNPVHAILSKNPCMYTMGYDVIGMSECVYWGAKFLTERYHLPIYITESGTDLPEWKDRFGQIDDSMRAELIRRYLGNAIKAYEEGIDIRGYYVWSIMDNFEWSSGFTRKFGLVYVDFDTLERIPKKSYFEYQKMIQNYHKDKKLF